MRDPGYCYTAFFRDRIVTLDASFPADTLPLALAHLIGQLCRQHAFAVGLSAVYVVHAPPLAEQVAGIIGAQVRHAVDMDKVGGCHRAFDLVGLLTAALGVNIQQI